MAVSPQRLTIYLYSAHRAVIFGIAQLSCVLYCLYNGYWRILVCFFLYFVFLFFIYTLAASVFYGWPALLTFGFSGNPALLLLVLNCHNCCLFESNKYLLLLLLLLLNLTFSLLPITSSHTVTRQRHRLDLQVLLALNI